MVASSVIKRIAECVDRMEAEVAAQSGDIHVVGLEAEISEAIRSGRARATDQFIVTGVERPW